MVETRSRKMKRQRLMSISSQVSSWPDLPARFESLNDDALGLILQFVGNKSYRSFGGLNKHCKEVYLNTPGMTKETFLFGYAPLSVIKDRIERAIEADKIERSDVIFDLQLALGKGVVLYNRGDVLEWALQERRMNLLRSICDVAAEEKRLDIMEEVFNRVEGRCKRERIFEDLLTYSSTKKNNGKLAVLKWLEERKLGVDIEHCLSQSVRYGHLDILEWLLEEKKDLELSGYLYHCAIDGGQLQSMKWLREQGCPWSEFSLMATAYRGNLDILQWLHDEGCPWPLDDEDNFVSERSLKPEVINWLHANGYRDRIRSI